MIFEEIKNAVSVPESARHYGIESKSNGMCRCPFHDDRHPSMKLYDDNYYCFGCGAHGDVIELTGRLFGLTALQAAEKLIRDFGLDIPINRKMSPAEKKNRIRKANEALRSEKINRAFHLAIRDLRQILVSCKEKLDDWKFSLAPESRDIPPEKWDSRFVTAHVWCDYVDYLIDLLDFGESDDRFELFVRRKEVKNIAERLVTDPGTAGCCRTAAVS